MSLDSDYSIRPVRQDDLAAIVRIDEQSTGESRETYLGRKLDDALDKKWRMIASNVVEYSGEVVGFLMAEVVSGEFGLPENQATIDTIGILPDYRGKGLASELFDHTLNQLQKLGITKIQTLVDWKDQGLIRFFANKGFAPGKMVFLELETNNS